MLHSSNLIAAIVAAIVALLLLLGVATTVDAAPAPASPLHRRGSGNGKTDPTKPPAIQPPLPLPSPASGPSSGPWQVGVGIADITPPIGEINMMGYASLAQDANGIHLRTYARAFIFASASSTASRVCFINSDTAAASFVIKSMALAMLKDYLPPSDAALYTNDNVMISSTHTHAATGAYNDDFLYQVTSFGVFQQVRESIATGYAIAIAKAHRDFISTNPSDIQISTGYLADASINRAKFGYANNPPEEKARYEADVDHTYTVVAVKDNSRLRGVLSWFPVHPTSMNETNDLVSGDNKGAASYFWETAEKANGNPYFVAAFCQSNAGDVSPNTQGPKCTDTGAACDGRADSCNGNPDKCIARGPGYEIGGDMLSTKIIGTKQYEATRQAVQNSSTTSNSGSTVAYRHAFVDMSNVTVVLKDGSIAHTCKPSMGASFAGGTVDGPGISLAAQGSNTTNPLLKFISNLILTVPPQDLVDCQAPKPILLPTGVDTFPYAWQPTVLPLQMFVVGSKLAIIGQPSEITTMAGRRLREAVKNVLVADGTMDADGQVAIAGLSNQYSSYLATFEEYQTQSYEGACTIFGPHSLQAYIQLFTQMAHSFADPSAAVPAGTPIQTHASSDISLLNPVVFDAPQIGHSFGDVLTQPPTSVSAGTKVTAVFACAHPRNGDGAWSQQQSSFMAVETLNPATNSWEFVMGDEGWDTTFHWARDGLAASKCTVGWSVGETLPVPNGTYRFRMYGRSRVSVPVVGAVFNPFTGVTDAFTVTN